MTASRDAPLEAVEVTGTVDEAGRLALDEPLSRVGPGRVRLIVLFATPAHDREAIAEEREWLHAAATNAAFDFLKDPVEDIYTASDGIPFHDAG